MFTGIVEEIGTIESVIQHNLGATLTIKAAKVLEEERLIGESVAVNGTCLTISKVNHRNSFSADVMPETMRQTNLGQLQIGSKVNLERAMRADGRFGGHLVTGHIDGIGVISDIKKEDNAVWVTIRTDHHLLNQMIPRGSITVDGVSLTIARLEKEWFQVSLIPHTAMVTTLLEQKTSATVNLETDLVGKYVARFLENLPEEKKELSLDFLKENGFY